MGQHDFFDANSYTTNDEWKQIIEPHLRKSSSFEIHCWNDEAKEIQKALAYGRLKETSWQQGKIISGLVTVNFIQHILSTTKPIDTDICNKMTPYFSIFLDDGFSSEHYGTELNIQETSET